MDVTLPLNEMTVAEKLQAIKVLGTTSGETQRTCHPRRGMKRFWHRQRQIDEGRAKFIPLDEFRQGIEKEIP